MASKKPLGIVPYYDHQRRTCIQVERTETHVKYIPLDIVEGLRVVATTAKEFDRRYKPMTGYPVERACQLYLTYSRNIGATKEALSYLGQVIDVSNKEANMAITKKIAATEKAAANRAAKKAALAEPAAKAVPAATAAKAAKAAPAKAAAVEPATKKGGRKMSAAQMFQDLIMQGELTDDQIFEKVQAQFGLDEKKRGYVKWYRNHLKKRGFNPPEAK